MPVGGILYPDPVGGVGMDFEACEVVLEKRAEEDNSPLLVVMAPLI